MLGENNGDKGIRSNKADLRQVVVEAPNVESKINDGYLLIGWYPDGKKAVLQPSNSHSRTPMSSSLSVSL